MTTVAVRNGDRVAALENDVAILAWLHAEQAAQVQKLALAVSGLLVKQMQPQIRQAILNQLLGAAPPG